MVTDRDLTIRVLAQGKDGNTAVRDAMSSDIQCCKVDDSLDDVEKIMSRHQVRRVPIVDENNRVVGMVAQADLARERKAVGEQGLRQGAGEDLRARRRPLGFLGLTRPEASGRGPHFSGSISPIRFPRYPALPL